MTSFVETARRQTLAAVLAVSAMPTLAAPVPDVFWRTLGQLAAATAQGGQAVVAQWPGKPFSLTRGAGATGEISSEPVTLFPGLQSAIAEVRLAEGNAVQLMVLELQGRCITPADVGAHYQQVANADFPQPDNPDPVSYRRVEIDGVRLSFGFRGAAPGCMTHVVFNPQAR